MSHGEQAKTRDPVISDPTPVTDVPVGGAEDSVVFQDPVSQRYQIEGLLGEGGMGTVYRARDLHLNRVVALKVIRPDALTTEMRARFKTEAEAVARLDHPHIIKIYDSGEIHLPNGRPRSPHLALEYVPGGSLAKALQDGKLRGPNGIRESAHLIAVLARAIHHAHGKGIVHRDLKPDNILLAERSDVAALNTAVGLPKITDFGLARHVESTQRLTLTGAFIGTPTYMAPEQAMSKKDVGPAADSWALGVNLYECLTGQVPFRGDSMLDLLNKICGQAPLPMRTHCPEVPEELEKICLDCLQKNPDKRPSANELYLRLGRFLTGPSKGTVRPATAAGQAQATVKEHLLALATGVTLRLVSIPGTKSTCPRTGKFTLGSPPEEVGRDADEEQYQVEISPFYLGIYPVTQGQFRAVMGYNPSYFSVDAVGKPGASYAVKPGGGKEQVRGTNTDDLPVENVSHEEAREFVAKLNELDAKRPAGHAYRLPREAEWEYACRGGATTYQTFHYGERLSAKQANFDGLSPYGGADKVKSPNRTTTVGAYERNAFGLYDVHGNVWEWCADWYAANASGVGQRDPAGPGTGSFRVMRGGSWSNAAAECRSAERDWNAPGVRFSDLGFRVALAERR